MFEWMKYFKNFWYLIFNRESIDRYNPHKQKLFVILN